MRVAHVITGLEQGGAEAMLAALARRTRPELDDVTVLSLTTAGFHGAALRAAGIEVESLGMRLGPAGAAAAWRLVSRLRAARPDVVQTWLYHADLFGGLVARSLGRPVVWGVHTLPLAPGRSRASTRAVARACAALSGVVPARVVFCSEAGRAAHAAAGYDDRRAVVIENGVDTARFSPAADARRLRASLGLDPDRALVGMVARFHPEKNHRLFCEAAAILAARRPDVGFVLCGRGVSAGNGQLAAWLAERGVSGRTRLLGEVASPEEVLGALDVATLTSHAESFPLSVAEAMSCAVPCVATDVGDVARLVGSDGWVVPPADAPALAAAWEASLALGADARLALGRRARQRVVEGFSLERAAERYLRLWREVAGVSAA